MMKQLEMSNFGVLEMQQEEMREIDGGYVKYVYEGLKWIGGLLATMIAQDIKDGKINSNPYQSAGMSGMNTAGDSY